MVQLEFLKTRTITAQHRACHVSLHNACARPITADLICLQVSYLTSCLSPSLSILLRFFTNYYYLLVFFYPDSFTLVQPWQLKMPFWASLRKLPRLQLLLDSFAWISWREKLAIIPIRIVFLSKPIQNTFLAWDHMIYPREFLLSI